MVAGESQMAQLAAEPGARYLTHVNTCRLRGGCPSQEPVPENERPAEPVSADDRPSAVEPRQRHTAWLRPVQAARDKQVPEPTTRTQFEDAVLPHLHAHLDGELDVVSDVALVHHLEQCLECAQTYRSQQALRAALRTGPASEDLLTHEIIVGHTRSLMAAHLTDVTSSDQHTVKPWFEGKLPFAPPVQELAAQGFPPIGGRLDYVGNRTVAALIYQRRQHVINLFLWPVTSDVAPEEIERTRHGYNLIHWTTADMTYWVVSSLNMGELQEFVNLVQQSALPARNPQ